MGLGLAKRDVFKDREGMHWLEIALPSGGAQSIAAE
ncbi:MAG: hypothetical protein ACI84E_002313 [Planctomycetota bacterium]|jgi:hypothetical protein